MAGRGSGEVQAETIEGCMKPLPVTTLEQAQALPLAHPEFATELMPAGETVLTRLAQKFYPRPVDGDQILFFTDADGRSMRVEYDERGPVKREIYSFP